MNHAAKAHQEALAVVSILENFVNPVDLGAWFKLAEASVKPLVVLCLPSVQKIMDRAKQKEQRERTLKVGHQYRVERAEG